MGTSEVEPQGSSVDDAVTVTGHVREVIAGDAQFSALTPEERTVAHATIDQAMAVRAMEQRFGVLTGAGDLGGPE